MPIDTIKARELIRAASLHRLHPGGELIVALADQLAEAVKDANSASDAVRTAQLDVQSAQRALADEQRSASDHKVNAPRFQAVIEGMRQIAAGAKGPKKLAHDVLTASGFADQPVVPFEKAEGGA